MLHRLVVAILVLNLGGTICAPRQYDSAAKEFVWNWQDAQELYRRESLRIAKIPNSLRNQIAQSIAAQIRPNMADLEIDSESQLMELALAARVKFIDLNGDGVAEVVAQSEADCSPTGNCSVWVFQKTKTSYRLVLEGFGQTFTIRPQKTNRFHDIVVAMHGSATQSGLTDFRFRNGRYEDSGCYSAEWHTADGDEIHPIKEPHISPCR